MKYLLYIDMHTVKCSVDIVEKIIKENSDSYLQISDSLWAFDTYEHSLCWEFQSVTEYFIRNLLDKYLVENSICFIHKVDIKNADYNLTIAAAEYLFNECI